MENVSQRQGAAEPAARGRWLSLIVVCLGVMMAFVNASSTISALPSIQDDLHTAGSTLVWVTSAFTLAVVSLIMSAGTFGELHGRRLTYVVGVVLLTAGSLVSTLAGAAGTLLAGQAIMGVGAAAVLPSGLAIVSTIFRDPRERTTAISTWASCAGLGLAVGPLVAGFLLDHFSWHSVYVTNVVIGTVAFVLAVTVLPESRHPSRQLDRAGVVLGTVTAAAATFAIIQGGASGYGDPVIVVAYLVAGVGLLAFVLVEQAHHDPMLDLTLFRNASFTTVMIVSAASMFGFVGIALLSVLHLERVLGLDALETGVRLMPMMAAYIVVSALAARLVRDFGITTTLAVGLVGMGSGALSLLLNGADTGYSHMWPGLSLTGVGAALLVAPATAAAINSVGPLQAGMAAATVNLFRQLGSMLGPAILGTIATSRFPAALERQLLDTGVPPTPAGAIASSVSHGHHPPLDAGTAQVLGEAVPRALTTTLHSGLLTGGVVLLVLAIPVTVFVRDHTRRSTDVAVLPDAPQHGAGVRS